jgi:hypothetical protein
MPRYNYICLDCEEKAAAEYGEDMTPEQFEELILFETSHSMDPTDEELAEATVCPRCSGGNCKKSFHGLDIHSYIRGYGWSDKEGAKRDMHRYTLQHNDPYSEHRVPGEVEHIDQTLQQEGKRQSNSKHYEVRQDKSMDEAVRKATKRE